MSKEMKVAVWLSVAFVLAVVAWRATQPAYDHSRDIGLQKESREQQQINFVSQQSHLAYLRGLSHDVSDRFDVVKVVPDDTLNLDRVVVRRQGDGTIFSVLVKPGLKMVVGEQVCIAEFSYYFYRGQMEEIKFAVPAAGATPGVSK